MKYDAWRRSKHIQDEFEKSLKYLVKLFNKIASSSGSDQVKYAQKMDNFQNSKEFDAYINSAVKRMVTPLAVSNMATWRKAARKASKSKMLYNSLMKEIKGGLDKDINIQLQENVNLIKTLPHDVANSVVKQISKEALAGKRASEIARMIRDKTDQYSRASARLIARTEVSKTTTALTKARSENLDINWYVWRTAEDGNRVRKSHQIMNGVLVSWKDPPSPEALAGEENVGYYHAGNIYNCRCYPEPLLEIEDIKWPHKVYYNGQIKVMGKEEFKRYV